MKHLPLSMDFEFEIQITRKNSATGIPENAGGLTGWTVHISLTRGGAAINGTLSKSLTERTQNPGVYYAIFETDDLLDHINDQTRVWFVLVKSGDVTDFSIPYLAIRNATG